MDQASSDTSHTTIDRSRLEARDMSRDVCERVVVLIVRRTDHQEVRSVRREGATAETWGRNPTTRRTLQVALPVN